MNAEQGRTEQDRAERFLRDEVTRVRAELGLPNHPFDPGWSAMSTTCNQLVLDPEGFGTDCGKTAAVHP